jgi:hypothetical protein
MVTGGLSTSASPAVSPQANGSAAPVYIAEAHWADGEDGPTLVVVPSDAAREARGSSTAGEAGWLQLESLVDGLAEHPAKDRLRHQYICHQQFASIAEPDKATWELEVERPDVGYPATVAARCNPVQ